MQHRVFVDFCTTDSIRAGLRNDADEIQAKPFLFEHGQRVGKTTARTSTNTQPGVVNWFNIWQ